MREVRVKDLVEMVNHLMECGWGERIILLSDDDEGNGFHSTPYGFTKVDYIFEEEYPPSLSASVSPKDAKDKCIIFG